MHNSYLSEYSFNLSNDTKCVNGVIIFQTLLDLCVNDTRSWLAVICGLLSILAWVVYGLPQMIINCRKGIPDEAISPWLLIFWTIGDTSNMVGAILTKQLMLQIVMAGYAIFCDFILVGQFTFAILRRRWKSNVGPQDILYSDNSNYIDSVSVNVDEAGNLKQPANSIQAGATALFCLSFLCVSTLFIFQQPSVGTVYTGRVLLGLTDQPTSFISGYREIFGYVLGILSSIFYCSGRIPQIHMNFRRKCTEGLSAGLFLIVIAGNLTYGAQILLVSTERIHMLRHLPWIIGSWGVMLLDCVILSQFFKYRHNKATPYYRLNPDIEDSDDDFIS